MNNDIWKARMEANARSRERMVGELTDDELDRVMGKKDILLGLLRKSTDIPVHKPSRKLTSGSRNLITNRSLSTSLTNTPPLLKRGSIFL